MLNGLIFYLYIINVLIDLEELLALILVPMLGITIMILAASFLIAFNKGDEIYDDVNPLIVKSRKIFCTMLVVLSLLKVAIPSPNTMYVSLGLHLTQQVVHSENMTQVNEQLLRILQDKLDEYGKEQTNE